MVLNWELESVVHERRQSNLSYQYPEATSEKGFDVLVNTVPITALNSALDRDDLNTDLDFRSMAFCFLDIPMPRNSTTTTGYTFLNGSTHSRE